MKKIDLMKVLKNVLLRFWLPVILAVIGMAGMLLIDLSGRKVIWDLDSRYTVYIENENAYEGHLYREQLAETLCELLKSDIELREMTIDKEDDDKALLSRYSISWENRRIRLQLRGDEEKLELMDEVWQAFETKAREYLEIEAGKNGVLEMDRYILEENENLSKQLPKAKTVAFGGLLGFCAGMVILLIREYVKSPKAKSEDDE